MGTLTIGTPMLKTVRCNIYGGENPGPDEVKFFGGMTETRPQKFFYCTNASVGRFRMKCPHGHVGQIMQVCQSHVLQWRDCIDICPTCQAPGQELHKGVKCRLRLESVA
jgi:hypothetical protein